MRLFRCGSHEVDILAQVWTALQTTRTTAAPAGGVDRNSIADGQAGCISSNLYDLARDLMTENQGRLHDEITGPSMPEVVHIRPADPACAKTHADQSRWKWLEGFFHHAKILRAKQRCR